MAIGYSDTSTLGRGSQEPEGARVPLTGRSALTRQGCGTKQALYDSTPPYIDQFVNARGVLSDGEYINQSPERAGEMYLPPEDAALFARFIARL